MRRINTTYDKKKKHGPAYSIPEYALKIGRHRATVFAAVKESGIDVQFVTHRNKGGNANLYSLSDLDSVAKAKGWI